MQKILQGLHRFQSEVFGSQRELFERLAHGQSPEALFITCADSRISPTLITQSNPGELFILRNAGNLVPPYGFTGGEAATIEYAVAVLGVADIIVCGHSDCGAMKALVHPTPALEELAAVSNWLKVAEPTRRIVRECYGHCDAKSQFEAAIQENVLVQLENLQTHPTVASSIRQGRLHLHGWVYQIGTGDILAYQPEARAFTSMRRVVEVPA